MDQNPQPSTQPVQDAPIQEQPQALASTVEDNGKKPSKRLRVFVIVALVFLVVGIGTYFVMSSLLEDNDKEVQSFLSAIYEEDYSAAYNHFSVQLQDVQSQEVFETQIHSLEAAGVNSSCTTDWTTNVISASTDSGSTKEISGDLNCGDSTFSADFGLVKQGDSYKMFSYAIQPK